MIFFNLNTFLLTALVIIFYLIIRRYSKSTLTNKILLLSGNFAIINLIAKPKEIVFLILISTGVYFLGKKIQQTKNKALMIGGISILIIGFILKNYQILELKIIQRIGMSYILFRLIHFLLESKRDTLKSSDVLTFINYILYFPNFLAGPIDDYNNFHYWLNRGKSTYGNMLIKAGIVRLLIGVIKKYLLVPLIVNFALTFAHMPEDISWQLSVIISVIFYSFYIIFDFSGYSDIAIGTAYLMGIKTPENFDNPYSAPNLSSFWKKWHMTFSNFLFKNVFIPFASFMTKISGSKRRLWVTFLAYFFTFTICGMWHGNKMNFIYWGLWHGLGLVLYKVFDIYVIKQKTAGIIRRYLGVAVTFCFVSVGWFFFNYSTNDIHSVVSNFTNSNPHRASISMVKQENKKGILIELENTLSPLNGTFTLEDNQGNFIYFDRKEIEPMKTFLLIPKAKYQGLVQVNIIDADGTTSTILDYFNTKIPDQSDLSKNLFWEYPQISEFKK